MQRFLPNAWFILTGILVIARMMVVVPTAETGISLPILLLTQLISSISSGLFTIAIGLTYMLVFKRIESRRVVILGWVHLGLYGLASLSSSIIGLQRSRALADGDVLGMSDFVILAAISSLTYIAAGIVFIIALISAISQVRKPIIAADFDWKLRPDGLRTELVMSATGVKRAGNTGSISPFAHFACRIAWTVEVEIHWPNVSNAIAKPGHMKRFKSYIWWQRREWA